MNKVKEFIEKNKEHEDLIRKSIELYNELKNKSYDEMCKICGCKLTPEDKSNLEANHFAITCKEHAKYGLFFNYDAVRRESNIEFKPFYDNQLDTIIKIANGNKQHEDLVYKSIEVYKEMQNEVYSNICEICGCKLTKEEIESSKPQHFSDTCNEHKKFACRYDLVSTREEFGIEFKPFYNTEF